MGLNDYRSYNKRKVDKFAQHVNRHQATPAEENLICDTLAITDPMNPMPRVRNQPKARMQVDLEVARLITMLTRDAGMALDRPMKALDIGTFTGLSAGSLAKGMREAALFKGRSLENGGKVITYDVSDTYLPIAQKFWKAEGVASLIEHNVCAPQKGAKAELDALIQDPSQLETYDVVVIDADKLNYGHYYDQALKLLRVGGKIIIDNMLWSGRVTNRRDRAEDAQTAFLYALNQRMSRDESTDFGLYTMADGVAVITKMREKTPEMIEREQAREANAGKEAYLQRIKMQHAHHAAR